jgi:cytochrome c556
MIIGAGGLAVTRAQQSSPQPAQQPPAQGAQPPAQTPAAPPAAPTPPPAKPLVPVAASSLAANPDAYVGEQVSLSAAVETSLSKTAFSVDQDKTKSTGKEVLVLVPTIQSPVEPNTYVTVLGEVVKFDPAAIGAKLKDYKLDLPPDVAAKYAGKPVIIATSVIDVAGKDIAKRLPPPMTAEEEGYQKLMKQVGSSNGALRKAIEGSDVKLTTEQTAALKKTFVEVEAFWKARRKNDAAQWSQDARKLSENIERSVAAAKWDDVKTHAATLGKACQTCHAAYRERFDDGSFRIKKEGTE